MPPTRVLIQGAAGRDFHDFNTVFRGDDDVEVVAFTRSAGQNLGELDDEPERRYPPELAGDGYPEGIPIYSESELETVVSEHDVDQVVFSYSDVSHRHVMHQASRSLATEAEFRILGPGQMWVHLDVPVVAIDAVRTGCGKSQTSRRVADGLEEIGLDPVIVREPMPYGDLVSQRVQRFTSRGDIDEAGVTIEEREEYEQHVDAGHVVYAGVDYEEIGERATAESDVVVWDGGNNELPFFEPDLHFVLADPHRPGHEMRYHPGETNLRLADYVVVNKENTASQAGIDEVVANVEAVNPNAEVVHADSVVSFDEDAVRGKRALVVEDGPTLTHGGAPSGAGAIAAERGGASEIVDPRETAVGSIADVFERYSHLGDVLPAMGYSDDQLADLEGSIRATDCDVVVAGTPIDLARLIDVDVPVVRVTYDLVERDRTIVSILEAHADVLDQ